jgi:flagellar hook-associated protein 2
MPISSVGVGSGLDAESIITKLMAAESQPLTVLKTKEASLQGKVSLFGKVQSLYADLQASARDLASPTLWGQMVATSTNPAAVAVASGSNAPAGNYAVGVQRLAASQTVTASALPTAASTLNSGTLTIELGTWTGTPVSGFTARTGSSAVSITIGAGETSLSAIRDKINSAGAGVSASIVTDRNGARLSLRSTTSGAENGFRISAVEDSDDGNPATGLTALGYSALAASPMTLNVAAQDAQATINGIDIAAGTNSLDGVVEGLGLTLLAPTTADVAVSVAADATATRAAIDKFVAAFNALATYIHDQTKYNPDSKTASPLQGNRTVLGLQSQLRGVLNQASTASTAFATLSDIGISMRADGTLETKSGKLDAALANRAEVKKLFATEGSTSASSGFMVRFRKLADAALGSGGALDGATTSLQAQIKNIVKNEDSMQLRLAATEKRLRAQYQGLDAQMAGLNSLSSYVSAQIASWNRPAN